MRNLFNNYKKNTDIGLVINLNFHFRDKWVSVFGKYFTQALIDTFNPIIIDSQLMYNVYKRRLRFIISMEPGWSSPKINYDTGIECIKLVFYSDPHYNSEERLKYFIKNNFSFVLSPYKDPFFRYFNNFPTEKFIHFPWAVPDQFVSDNDLRISDSVIIFGGKNSAAYTMRNWCREQKGVTNYEFSGVENKHLNDEDFYKFLRYQSAVVAAGSFDSKYDMVTPKYFEILSSGALLIGQYCSDLDSLNIDNNCAQIFSNEEGFIDIIESVKNNPKLYLNQRFKGRELIKKNHLISNRISTIKSIFEYEQ